MAGSAGNDNDEITGINVTPLVDVMLVLLIIFMVTATYIVQQSIKVTLPKASTGEQSEATNLAFVLDKDGKLYLDGQTLAFEQVEQAIASKRANVEAGKALQALIAADKETTHGAVVKIIDLVRKSGITEFALNIEAEQ